MKLTLPVLTKKRHMESKEKIKVELQREKEIKNKELNMIKIIKNG